jgi:hypothetical protein
VRVHARAGLGGDQVQPAARRGPGQEVARRAITLQGSATTLQPSTITLQGSATTLQPSAITLQGSATTLQPSTITLLASVVTLLASVVTLLASVVTLLASVVTLLASVVTLLASIVTLLASIVTRGERSVLVRSYWKAETCALRLSPGAGLRGERRAVARTPQVSAGSGATRTAGRGSYAAGGGEG